MAKQRQQLNARLGLNMAAQMGIDTSNLFTNEDLINNSDKKINCDNVRVNIIAGTS